MPRSNLAGAKAAAKDQGVSDNVRATALHMSEKPGERQYQRKYARREAKSDEEKEVAFNVCFASSFGSLKHAME